MSTLKFLSACLLLFPALPVGAEIHLTLDRSALDFGPLDPGAQSLPIVVRCQVRSTEPLPWSLSLEATAEAHEDGTPFPSQNFRYWFTQDHPGTENPPFSTDAPVPTAPTMIYSAQSEEYVTDSTDLGIAFKVLISPAQKAGRYSITIVFGLTNQV